MTTECPMRLAESTGAIMWPASKVAGTYTSSDNFKGTGIGFLLKGNEYQPNRREVVPNRSGSAPPSMEGSFAAIGNFVALKNLNAGFENSRETYKSEEQLRTDPSYLAYYCSNVNLNPRLPPPLISRENRRLVRHIGDFGGSRKLISFDDSSSGYLQLSKDVLSTHKEETEDDRSIQQCDDLAESNAFLSEQCKLAGRHKSLVDLIQEDFPRTPSPVYNHQLLSNQVAEVVEPNGLVKSLHDSSVSATNSLESSATLVENAGTLASLVHIVGSVPNSDSTVLPSPKSSSSEKTGSPQPSRKGKSSVVATYVEDGGIVSGLTDSDINMSESKMKNLCIPSLQDNNDQQNRPHPHPWHAQRGATHQLQGPRAQIISQGINNPYNSMDQFRHSHPKFPIEMQPILQPSGVVPPFATATAYMTPGSPVYPSLQSPGLFASQYSVGGYALNMTFLPPFMTGYSHCAIPMGFGATVGPSFSNARTTSVLTMGGIAPGVDFQDPYTFYGPPGLTVQPSFADPGYMQFIQHSSEGPFGLSNLYHPLRPGSGIAHSQVEAIDSHKGPFMAAYTADPKPRHQTCGVPIANVNKAGIASLNYYGSPSDMGVRMQLPTSPLATPVIPGSPVDGMGLTGRRNDLRFPPGSSKSTGTYSEWQSQKVSDRCDDPKTFSFLEELKSSKSRKFELSDIVGHIVEFSADQHGSRFIQQKLETCRTEEKSCLFKEVLLHASKLITDVFGNYVVQKFFEYGSNEERKELADQLAGRMLPLSLQMYGCRVIQKALEVIELDQKTRLVHELDGNVIKCVRDQNGNHVIQKCIECVPTERIGFIISAFHGQVAALSTHPYGCRVIQRVLEYCEDELQSQSIIDEILESSCTLAEDQYGNYVIQHVLERGKCHERSQIINSMAGKIVQMSQHKYASNVVEKCLTHGDAAERDLLIEEIVGQTEGNDNLLVMMKDQFANYVVQKILDLCTDMQREILLSRIRVHLHALKKYTYGKHIVVRFEQLSGEAEDHDLDT